MATTVTGTQPRAGRRAVTPGVVHALVAIVTVGYLVEFVARASTLVPAIYTVADTDIAPYLTQSWLQRAPGAVALVGNDLWYTGFFIMRVLKLAPDFRGTWMIAPWVLSVLACVSVGWATARVAGRAAGLLVTAALVCAGTQLLALQFSWSIHGVSYPHVLLLGAFSVWLAEDPWSGRRVRFWLVVLVMGLITAVGVASDKLVLIAGVIPFAVAGVALVPLAPRPARLRLGAALVVVAVGGFLGSLLVGTVMRHYGLSADAFPITLVTSLGQVPPHLLLLLQGTFSLLNGYLHSVDVLPTGALGYICSGAVALLIALALVLLGRVLLAGFTGTWRRVRRARSPEAAAGAGTVGATTVVHVIFWIVSLVALGLVYAVSTVAVDITTRRYIVTVAYAVVVLGVTGGMLLRSAPVRLATATAVGLIILTGAIGLIRNQIPYVNSVVTPFPTVKLSNAVNAAARREGVSVGYAGYWDAFPLGWLTPDAVPVYPVVACGPSLCPRLSLPSSGIAISSWYTPRPNVRSMLLYDAPTAGINDMPSTPPASLGRPIATLHIDGRVTMYVYGYDIVAKL